MRQGRRSRRHATPAAAAALGNCVDVPAVASCVTYIFSSDLEKLRGAAAAARRRNVAATRACVCACSCDASSLFTSTYSYDVRSRKDEIIKKCNAPRVDYLLGNFVRKRFYLVLVNYI